MSFPKISNGCIATTTMAIAAGGLIVAAPPAHAAKCIQQGFSVGEVRFQAVDGSELKFFTNGGANASGPGSISGTNPGTGTLVGGISGRRVDVTITWGDNLSRTYVGNVGDDGVARGTVNNPPSNWISTAITCLQEEAPQAPPPEAPKPEAPPAQAPPAPLQGPSVAPKEGLAGVTFAVTDRSGTASQCTYSSEGFDKGFALPANGTVDVFVPAVRLLKQRTGTITCDNGTSANTSVFF